MALKRDSKVVVRALGEFEFAARHQGLLEGRASARIQQQTRWLADGVDYRADVTSRQQANDGKVNCACELGEL